MANVAARKRSGHASHTSSDKNGSAHKDETDFATTTKAVIQTTASEWLMILSLIFGGCCSNAYTLELATRQLPTSGTLITFAQFSVTTMSCLPYFVSWQSGLPRLKERNVPVYRWLVQVVFYLSTSLLNNMAFAYDVPMPVHIVFRSGGLVINMILGYLVEHHRYSKVQVASVLLVTAGVISSTLCASSGPVETAQDTDDLSPDAYLTGVLYLFAALVLSGFMGLWQEKTFRLYGNQNWRESLFYSHLLSLPIFALRGRSLLRDIRQGNETIPWWFGWGPPTHAPTRSRRTLPSSWIAGLLRREQTVGAEKIFDLAILVPKSMRRAVKLRAGVWIPSFYPPLLLNVATQLLCINGVNRLTSKVSSLSVTLVLVVRKALSLFISVMIVSGGTGNLGLWLGASAVLLGTIGYSLSKPVMQKPRSKSE